MKRNNYSFLLMGTPGTGKTHSAATMALLDSIEKVNFLFTETSDATFDSDNFIKLRKYLGKKIHYMRAIPTTGSFKEMLQTADDVLRLSLESLQKKTSIGGPEVKKAFHKVLNGLIAYECEMTGEKFPPVDDWPSSYCLVLDSLTGINNAIRKLLVGTKPIMALSDWQIGMNMEEDLIQRLTGALDCQVIVTAHITRERDEITGALTVTPNALGSKLGPVIPRYFDEVIMTKYSRSGDYLWSTDEHNADLKARLLPRSNKLQPTFTQLKQLENLK